MSRRKEFVIAVDFNGTIVKHAYPEIGEDIGAVPWLLKLQDMGVRLILYTMRDDGDPKRSQARPVLTEAVAWCDERGIKFWGVNVNPSQKHWSSSPKIYAQLYVDDAALGITLAGKDSEDDSERPWVDWSEVGPELVNMAAERFGLSLDEAEDIVAEVLLVGS